MSEISYRWAALWYAACCLWTWFHSCWFWSGCSFISRELSGVDYRCEVSTGEQGVLHKCLFSVPCVLKSLNSMQVFCYLHYNISVRLMYMKVGGKLTLRLRISAVLQNMWFFWERKITFRGLTIFLFFLNVLLLLLLFCFVFVLIKWMHETILFKMKNKSLLNHWTGSLAIY